ncbi:alpha/beta hydrolase [Salinibacterium sp. ZJ77]|uniref:alpha/beta fold hydrolase n=1 Tax=Salinibacterium sp. ZJ77 TaxID=2708337 RepID=UPI001420DAEE|nr:alpha/beta hydrolase [Salinibacterium sp. ZJ77]
MTETETDLEPTEEFRSIWSSLRDVAFTQQWIDVDGVSTRVVTAGDPSKPALLMLHGTGAHWEAYAPSLKAFSADYYCIVPDMVGNGYTDKPDYDYEIHTYVAHLEGVLRVLDVERVHIFGMSLGAWVAARFAVKNPERTGKIVLMSPAGLLASAEKMSRIRRQRIAAVETADWESIRAMFVHLIADEANRLPDLIALRQAIYRLPETRDTIEHLLILQDSEVRNRNLLSIDEWKSIQAPALVIASGKDWGEYTSTARQILELMPKAQLLEMPHVAHWPNFEDPEMFNREALAFLAAEV